MPCFLDFFVSCCLQLYSTGTCGCIDYDLSQGDDYQTIYNSIVFLSDYVSGMNLDDDTKREITKAFCGMKVNDGDHLQVLCRVALDYQATVLIVSS